MYAFTSPQISAGNTALNGAYIQTGFLDASSGLWVTAGSTGVGAGNRFRVLGNTSVEYSSSFPTTSGYLTVSNTITAGNGVISTGSYAVGYNGGTVVDFLNGNARISAGTANGINFYNAGVGATLLANIGTAGTLTTTGNITAPYYFGDGSKLTNVGGTYGNTQVAAYLPTYTGNIGGITGATNILRGSTVQINSSANPLSLIAGAYSTLFQTDGSIVAPGSFATVGNITANAGAYFIGDGSKLTGISSGSSFSGNLLGNTLLDSTNGRILMSASPISNYYPNTTGSFVTNTAFNPNAISYSGTSTNSSGTAVYSAQGNINIITKSGTTTFTTGMYNLLQAAPSSGSASMNNNDRARGVLNLLEVYPQGKQWGAIGTSGASIATAANATPLVGMNGVTNVVGTGEVSHVIGIGSNAWLNPSGGSANVMILTGYNATVGYNALTPGTGRLASNVQYARLYAGSIPGNQAANLTIANAIGLHTINGWAPSTSGSISNRYAVLNEDSGTVIQTNGNVAFTNFTQPGTLYNYAEKINAFGTTSGTISPNASNAAVFTITLNGNMTMNSADVTMTAGQSIAVIITQDGTGGWTLTTNMLFAGGSKTLSTAAGAIDIINIFYDGTNKLCSLVKGYA